MFGKSLKYLHFLIFLSMPNWLYLLGGGSSNAYDEGYFRITPAQQIGGSFVSPPHSIGLVLSIWREKKCYLPATKTPHQGKVYWLCKQTRVHLLCMDEMVQNGPFVPLYCERSRFWEPDHVGEWKCGRKVGREIFALQSEVGFFLLLKG